MTRTEPHKIQEFRFRLRPEALAEETIAILEFPWQNAVEQFLSTIKSVRSDPKLKYKEYPPYASLNAALVALSTTLVHGFEKYSQPGQEDDDENEPRASRFLMVPGDSPRPRLDQLAVVIQPWLKSWTEQVFERELKDSKIRQAQQVLLESVYQPESDWETRNVWDLWPDHPFFFQALPSVLVKYLLTQATQINLEHTLIDLQLVKSSGKGHLQLVSQPIQSEAGGHFAYVFNFHIQTVPGDSLPYVQLGFHCRRYMEHHVQRLNFRRESTVYTRLHKPLLAGWPIDATLTPLKIAQDDGGRFYWNSETRHLLEEIKARDLVDPPTLASDSQRFWDTPDKYYWVYAEGMRPQHRLGNGFSPGELYHLWQAIVGLVRPVLTPVGLIERDMKTYNVRRPAAMLTMWELLDKSQVANFTDIGGKIRKLTPEYRHEMVEASLQRGLGTSTPCLLLLYRTENGRTLLREYAEMCLPATLPSDHIIEHRTEDGLTELFPKPKETTPVIYQQRRMSWGNLLKKLRPPTPQPTLALIEVPPEHKDNRDDRLKAVIREVCVSRQVASQLYVQPTGDEVDAGDTNRARNAAGDLLIRQVGAVYGDVREIYRLAGLPVEIADRLTVIGLYRRRTNGDTAIDFSLAVRLRPDGHAEMCWSGVSWQPYYQASLALGNHFRLNRSNGYKSDSKLKLPPAATQSFIEQITLGIDGPTLILAEAHDFRSAWPYLQNPNLRYNQLVLPNGQSYTPTDVPDLRFIRLRSAESEETPQYIRVSDDDDAQEARARASGDGVYPTERFGMGQIYHSANKMSAMTRRQSDGALKTELWGGRTSFKHQRILECIPFFMQPDDDPDIWARLTHYLRMAPAWDEGSPVLPLPSHLAVNALADVLLLLEAA